MRLWLAMVGVPHGGGGSPSAIPLYFSLILSYSARPGSTNDQSVFNRSTLDVFAGTMLPRGRYLVGDAGCVLGWYLIFLQDMDPAVFF